MGPKKDHIHLDLDHLPAGFLVKCLPCICETTTIFAGVGDQEAHPCSAYHALQYNMEGIPTRAGLSVFGLVGWSASWDGAARRPFDQDVLIVDSRLPFLVLLS